MIILTAAQGEELEKARREIRSHLKLISDLRKERAELLKQTQIESQQFEKLMFDSKTNTAMAAALHERVELAESLLKTCMLLLICSSS